MTRWWHFLLAGVAGLVVVATAVAGLSAALIYPNLPSLDSLTDYRPKQPLRIFTEDGALIGEFGEERRAVVRLKDTPQFMRQAILAAEDERFYQHGGVDTLGVLRAALANVISGGAKEGASTITMQVARNFFLTSEKSLRRKLNEALLAIKIEHALSKDEILELYLNHIYLGQRAYGLPRPPRSISASRWPGSIWLKRPCWPACPRRPRPTTRWSTRAAPNPANSMFWGA